MSKKLLVLTTSPRKDSNSEILADEFIRGAQSVGHSVEKINVAAKEIQYCKGCLACQDTGRCAIRDDMTQILDKLKSADVILFATPVYFYGMSGQMKTLLDRSNPLFPNQYAFRDIYLIATSADGGKESVDGTVTGLQGWIDCLENAKLAGVLHGGSVTGTGEARSQKDLLKKAFALGERI